MMRVRTVIGAALVGAAAAYLFDPLSGGGRRARLRDRTSAILRRARWRGEKLQRHAGNVIQGKMHKIRDLGEADRPMDDATIAQRVRSEVLGRPDFRADDIIVDVENGLARLRGQMEHPGRIEVIVDLTKKIPGVRAVETFIHAPGSSAPNKAAARSTRESS
jgi:osmotically-inducible protein OsmY